MSGQVFDDGTGHCVICDISVSREYLHLNNVTLLG